MDKRRLVNAAHRVVNPITRRLPGQVILETVGRVSGLPRRTPIGGRVIGDALWFVSMHGEAASYVRNIQADKAVRVRLRGRWRTGTAYVLPADDAEALNARMPWLTRTANSALGTKLLSIRVDLDP